MSEQFLEKRSWFRDTFLPKSKLLLVVYGLMFPTLLCMAVFSYYPKIDVFRFAFYRWEPNQIQEFTGLDNFFSAMEDQMFWQSFTIVLILLVANLFKMWPSIFTAIVLHRLRNDRWRYIYQVLFVVPMVIPELVWLLVWKSFFDPTTGLLNSFLNATGIIHVLRFLDVNMPIVAHYLGMVNTYFIDIVFGNVYGFLIFSAALLMSVGGRSKWFSRGLLWFFVLLPGAFLWGAVEVRFGVDTPVVYHFEGIVRSVCLLFVALFGADFLNKKCGELQANDIVRSIALWIFVVGGVLVLFTQIWVTPTGAFDSGNPSWLGNSNLILPALIMWGFPWVGIVGVMIYLAGLQNISNDVYEAAELDGVGPIGKLFKIELPLIMTQVRINLIFMTMGTLTGYGMFLILLGPEGGSDGAGMVPGLYMFKSAFTDTKFGYACMLGLIMFFLILFLTVIYQKYVKVDK